MYHLLFEQSGTFRDIFRKLGGVAKDYDIQNEYGKTDVQCDLFDCIDRAYLGLNDKVFSKIKPTDTVLAFFPCTEFECQKNMTMRGVSNQLTTASLEKKLNTDLYYHKLLHESYERITKLVLICLRIGCKLIIENPVTQPHYLTSYWSLKPAIIDNDRRENGDAMKKPTQYWFINGTPKNNLVCEPLHECETKRVEKIKGKEREKLRSEIHPQYAERFIKQYIADYNEENGEWII